MTAENVCTNETYQKKYGYNPITREQLDEFSYNSQVKADKAIKDGAFKDEIVPVVIKGKKGEMCIRDSNIPWLILFDPTSACNMHCVGCWAGEYGNKNNLSFEDMDKIVTQGKELGLSLIHILPQWQSAPSTLLQRCTRWGGWPWRSQ